MRNSINNITQFYNNNFSLSTKRVHVFLINFDLFNSDDFKEFLSNDEINRANKIKIVKKRHQFIISRGVVKKLLSTLLRKEADQIEFLYSQHGKPFINEKYYNHTIEFNISHSGIYGLIAITLDNKIGVDIQKIDPKVDYNSLSARFFSDNEKNELMKLDKNKRKDAFYLGWVRKESFIKAIGMGVAYGLDRFSVSLNKNDNANIVISDFENKKWHCYDLIEFNNYKTALTTCDNKIDIVISQ